MKKLLCILATLSIAFASFAEKATEDQINRAKAIAAYHVNRLSKPDIFKEEFCPKDMDVEKIQKLVCKYTENKKLTDYIAKSDAPDKEVSGIKKYYKEELFNDTIFKTFFAKKNRREDLKKSLDTELSVLFNKNIDNGKKCKSEPKDDNKAELSQNQSENRPDRSGLSPALSLLLAVLALGAAVYLYVLFVKMKNMLQDLRISNNHRKEEIDSLKQRIERLEGDSLKSRNMMTEMQRKVSENTKSIQSASINGQQTFGGGRPFVSTQRPVETEKDYYAGVPFDGCFKANENYSTKMLYKLTTRGEAVGEYEFVNRPEAVAIAQQSKTSFLDPACNIVNDDIANFSSIITEQKGKIEKTDNGWRITKKAVIRLA